MYVGRDWSVMNTGESEVFGLDFVNDLPTGDSLTSVVFTIAVVSGTDATPSSRLDGSPGISGTTAIQRISDLLPNVNYVLVAIAETALGNTLILYSRVRCMTPA